MVIRFSCIFLTVWTLLFCSACQPGKVGGNLPEPQTVTNPTPSMSFQLEFFQPWDDAFPHHIHKQDNSGGFLQMGPRTFTLYRPQITLRRESRQVIAFPSQDLERTLWQVETEVASEPLDKERHKVQQFHQPLLVQGDQVLVLASGQDVYVQEGDQQSEKIQLRGVAAVTEGQFQLAVRKGDELHLLPALEGQALLPVGPENPGNGAWTMYAASSGEILVANHHQVRTYGPNGELIREAALDNAVYENELFPRSWNITSVAAASLNSVLIAFVGPEGYGVGKVTW